MLVFKKKGYTKRDINELETILRIGRDMVIAHDCNKDCHNCKHRKVCRDVASLLDYLFFTKPTAKD